MSPCTILRVPMSVNPAFRCRGSHVAAPAVFVGYLPLLFSFGVVDVAPELGMLDDEDDVELDGVLLLGGVDALDDDSDDEGGVVLGLIDELDDVELSGGVDGVVVDDDGDVEGDGVTTGGVLLVVDDDSRLQPATPTMTPAQSNATKALFISISHKLKKWYLGFLADSVPCMPVPATRSTIKMSSEISAVVNWLQPFSCAHWREAPTFNAQFSPRAGNNYPGIAPRAAKGAFHFQIHAHGPDAAIGMLLAR